MRQTLFENENQFVEIENRRGEFFLHWQIYKWNKSVLKECREVVAALEYLGMENDVPAIHAAISPTSGPLLLKFCNLVRPYDEINDVPDHPDYKVVSWYVGE